MTETSSKMGMLGYLAGGVSLAAPFFLIASYLFLLKPTLFLAIGSLSILSIQLQERYQYIAIASIYLPALYALYLLLTMSSPAILIELAAGYFVALPILVAIAYIKSSTISSLYSSYLGVYISSLIMRDLLLESDGSAPSIFFALFSKITASSRSLALISGDGSISIVFPALVAISALGFIYYMAGRLGEARGKIFRSVYLSSLAAAVILVGILVAYSSFFSDAILAGAVLSAALLAIVSLRSRRS